MRILINLLYVVASIFLVNNFGCNSGRPNVDIKVEQNIVINNINFGINEKKFISLTPKDSVKIDVNNYAVSPFFNGSDQLYMMYFIGKIASEDGIEKELRKEIEELKAYFSKRYGRPENRGSYKSAKTLINGNSVEIYKWNVGYKEIILGIGLEGRDDKEYYVVGHIDHTNMRKLANKEGLD